MWLRGGKGFAHTAGLCCPLGLPPAGNSPVLAKNEGFHSVISSIKHTNLNFKVKYPEYLELPKRSEAAFCGRAAQPQRCARKGAQKKKKDKLIFLNEFTDVLSPSQGGILAGGETGRFPPGSPCRDQLTPVPGGLFYPKKAEIGHFPPLV